MRLISTIFIILLVVSGGAAQMPSPSPTPVVDRKYDRFENKTTVSTSPIVTAQSILIVATFDHSGRNCSTAPRSISLLVAAPDDAWRLLSAPPLRFLINDVGWIYDADRFRYLGLSPIPLNGKTMKTGHLDLAPFEFATMGEAKALAIKFGDVESDLSREEISRLGSLLDAIKQCR